MNKYFNRIRSSDRGETFNPLTYPFLISTLAYGIGFTLFSGTSGVGQSSLFIAMSTFGPAAPLIWGVVALIAITIGVLFLLFRTPPIGKVSGLIGFMVWLFASFCWIDSGGWLLLFAVGVPSMYFWFWQYFSLGKFKRQDEQDQATMKSYDRGGYDDKANPKDAKTDREFNRGMDRQTKGSYDNKDEGTDLSRPLDGD